MTVKPLNLFMLSEEKKARVMELLDSIAGSLGPADTWNEVKNLSEGEQLFTAKEIEAVAIKSVNDFDEFIESVKLSVLSILQHSHEVHLGYTQVCIKCGRWERILFEDNCANCGADRRYLLDVDGAIDLSKLGA